MDKKAIVCNTPFQILGAINLILNNVEGCSEKCDVFVINDFRKARDISHSLSRLNICDNVFLCSTITEKKSKIHVLGRLVFSNLAFQDYGLEEPSRFERVYEKILTGDGNALALSLKQVNKRAELIFYDDGIISYREGNPLIEDQGILYRTICKTLKIGLYRTGFDKMYVYIPEACNSKISNSKNKLPGLQDNPNVTDALCRVFEYKKKEDVLGKCVVLLGQMLNDLEGYNGIEFSRLIFEPYRSDYYYRLHPRQKGESIDGVLCDSSVTLWELDCLFEITDDHVLISCCSSSQFTPKMISGIEPYVIFTYKLFIDNKYKKVIERNDRYVEKLKQMYNNKDKIYVPDTFENYYLCLSKILEGVKEQIDDIKL